MKSIRLAAFALTLIACSRVALAQNEPANAVWRKFYGKLAAVARGSAKDARMMLCLQVPGLPLEPLDARKKADLAFASELLDQTAAYNPVFSPGKLPFSKLYGQILQTHRTDPPTPLTPGEKGELDKALQMIRPNSSSVRSYNVYRDLYGAAVQAREAERWWNLEAGRGWTNLPRSDDRVNGAMDNWLLHGRKSSVEASRRLVIQYSGSDSGPWWKALAEDYHQAAMGGFYGFATSPPMDKWTGEDGWMAFSFKPSDPRSFSKLNDMDVQAGQALKLGALSGAKQMEALLVDGTLEITMEIKKVIINRSWVDWQVFVNDQWTWGNGVISDEKGGGSLPLYTNAFIIARRVQLKAKSIEIHKGELLDEIQEHLDGGFGPFALKTATDRNPGGVQREAKDTIELPAPQIIAYCCLVVPRSPARSVK